jgi:hypothetical protein
MYKEGFKDHLAWLELRSQNKMVSCKCDQCILDASPPPTDDDSTTNKEYIQSSPKVVVSMTKTTDTPHQLYWDEVLKVQKVVLTKKHRFPPLMQKPKKKKTDYGSLKDIEPFAVQVPDVLPNPKSDYLLMKNIKKK